MRQRHVTVLGAGIAGLAAALHLARDGHAVVVVERDAQASGTPEDAFDWPRKGVAHFQLPHAFMPRGRKELREGLPDVYDALIAAGARDVDLRRKLPGELQDGDEDLQYLAVRRPVIEWALRDAVAREPRIEVCWDAEVSGLAVDGHRVTGIVAHGSSIHSDLVVDALGRRTKTPEWLAAAGVVEEPTETSDCGVVYYNRYYRLRDEFELPDGPWLLGPRGDLGYLGISTFPGDNRTFAGLLAVPPGQPSSRALKQPAAFEAAISSIPAMRAWVDPDGVDPITEVLTMAGLRNTYRSSESADVMGLVAIGDAVCHSDPVLALGLSFALIHARQLAEALREHADLGDAAAQLRARTAPLMRERFDYASALDEQRLRMWTGGGVDLSGPEGDFELFTLVAGGVAALKDPDVFRRVVRRIGLLETLSVLDDDPELLGRVGSIFRAESAVTRPPAGPTSDEMTEITELALAVAGHSA